MTVVLTGHDLGRAAVVRVARDGEPVEIHQSAIERMTRSRAVVTAATERGDPVYGLTTAVGVLKRAAVSADAASDYSRRMIRHHVVGQGPAAAPDLVRATMLRLANAFAEGSTGVRPELAERLVAALNRGDLPRIRTLGSIGQADLAPMADLALAVFGDVPLDPGEGLALVGSNAFSTGWASLAIADTATLLEAAEVAGALSLEALAANLTILDPAIAEVRPYPGLQLELTRLRTLLEGSALWDAGVARSLQDPLTFRNLPQLLGAWRDVLDHVDRQLAIELNASQGNPIVVPTDERIISVANFEILPLAVALDYLRIVLASVLTATAERVVKLLDAPWSGLPTGLVSGTDSTDPGLSYLAIAGQSLAAEARLLAQPVSFEVVSTAHAEGIEDRSTMAPLAAARLDELVDRGRRLVAIELTVAGQAAQLRGRRLGRGTAHGLELVRSRVSYVEPGGMVPDVEPLLELIASGAIRL
jgi:histidine ammonia-lyase